MRRAWVERGTPWTLAFLLALEPACGGERACDDIVYDPPGVLVVDAGTREPVCNATVTVRDGSYEHHGMSAPDQCDGLYFLEQRSAEYEVEVSAPGYEDETGHFVVAYDSCGEPIVSPEGPRDGLPGFAYTHTIGLRAR